jgi:hypothetical protein
MTSWYSGKSSSAWAFDWGKDEILSRPIILQFLPEFLLQTNSIARQEMIRLLGKPDKAWHLYP